MARKNKDFVDGCLASTWPLLIVFAPILYVLNFILENVGVILVIALIVGAIIAIAVAISTVVKKMEEKEAEKQRNICVVNTAERKPALLSVPQGNSFNSKEEELINLQFREFIRQNNVVIEANAHLEYLTEKAKALIALGRLNEADQLQSEIEEAHSSLNHAYTQRQVYESTNNAHLCRDAKMNEAYLRFAESITTEQIPFISDFFQDPMIKTVKAEECNALIFTPAYVMHYSEKLKYITLIRYNNVSVSTYLFTEILKGDRQADDEIEHIGYLHETKDGRRDMRYSYQNNPSYTFVYRGNATICCGNYSYEQRFSNKSQTVKFEKSLNDYLALIKKSDVLIKT